MSDVERLTTEQVKYWFSDDPDEGAVEVNNARFEVWLAEVKAEAVADFVASDSLDETVKAPAWDEGYCAGVDDVKGAAEFGSAYSGFLNPYKKFNVVTMPDGLPSIVVNSKETTEQVECRVRESEFHYWMGVLKANNGAGAMSPAMWLLYDIAYYERGFSDLGRWKVYLKKVDREGSDG